MQWRYTVEIEVVAKLLASALILGTGEHGVKELTVLKARSLPTSALRWNHHRGAAMTQQLIP